MNKLGELHGGEYKRAIFYFANGDDANVETHFEIPDIRKPAEIRDLHFKYCGHKIKKSEEFEKFVEQSVPVKFKSRFSKSEKGIDIEMCCDALKLASDGNIERIFLLSNDGDFIPFCRTIKEFGANISMIYLSEIIPPNGDLLLEADSYDVVGTNELYSIFLPPPSEAEIAAEMAAPASLAEADAIEEMLSEKPEAEPSDLETVDEEGDES
jgi:uncharacterized LabA/DUF88 family protein